MKKLSFVFVMMALVSSGVARADGWVCGTTDSELKIQVYNHVDADRGTRNAAVMVISDKSVRGGNKTIASFSDAEGSLTNSGATYLARVDRHIAEGGRVGEYIGGTRLGYVRTVLLDVYFNYGRPVRDGLLVNGKLVLEKLNGQTVTKHVGCARYLKNN